MNNKTVSVGDIVAWDDVPNGAMICGRIYNKIHYAVRIGDNGKWVGNDECWERWTDGWDWLGRPQHLKGRPKIIALNLTGNETADDLRALAEAFEREHPTHNA
jgi:hypothetical protein